MCLGCVVQLGCGPCLDKGVPGGMRCEGFRGSCGGGVEEIVEVPSPSAVVFDWVGDWLPMGVDECLLMGAAAGGREEDPQVQHCPPGLHRLPVVLHFLRACCQNWVVSCRMRHLVSFVAAL